MWPRRSPAAGSRRRRWRRPSKRRCGASRAARSTIPSMPDAVRLEVPDWLLPRIDRGANCRAAAGAGAARSARQPAEGHARGGPRRARRRGLDARRRRRFRPGACGIEGRRQVTTGPAFRAGLVEIQDEGSQLVAALVDARPGHARGRPVRRRRRQDAGAGDDDAEPRPAGRVRRLGRAAGRRGAPAAPRRRAQRRAPPAGARRQMDQAPRRQLRPRAGRCALHRYRHLAAQSGCAAAPDRGRPCRTAAEAGGDPRSGRVPGSQRRAFGLRYLFAARRGERGPGDCLSAPPSDFAMVSRCAARHGTDGFFAAVLERRSVADPARHGTDGFFAAVLERRA